MWKKKEEKKEGRKEEESLLKELCGDDAKLYDLLCRYLYLDPVAAISKTDLETLTEEAGKSIKDENYGEAMQKYRTAVDKAIFEATQNPGEKERYIKIIQDLASKTAKVTEKAKEKLEKEGKMKDASSYLDALARSVDHYEFMSERIEDVIRIASLFYNEKLAELGATERREARKKERGEADREWEKEQKEAGERREARRKERKGMGKRERKEAEIEESSIEEKEKQRREARKKEETEAETEEERIEEKEAERAKERREATRREEK